MPALYVESDAPEPGPFRFRSDAGALLALISFGVAEPFGTQHPLTEFVRRLKRQHAVEVEPLLTFYDRDVEDAEDAVKLEAAWQPAPALRDCLDAIGAALRADAALAAYLGETPELPALLLELRQMAAWAATREARIRMSFSLGVAG